MHDLLIINHSGDILSLDELFWHQFQIKPENMHLLNYKLQFVPVLCITPDKNKTLDNKALSG